MALNLSRGIVPNLFLWYGVGNFRFRPPDRPDVVPTYPTIPDVSTKPPCTPEIEGEICDPRCPSSGAGRDGCGSAVDFGSYCNTNPDHPVCQNERGITDFIKRVIAEQIKRGITIFNSLPTIAGVDRMSYEEKYTLYNVLIRSGRLRELGIFTGISGRRKNKCVINLRNESFINEC